MITAILHLFGSSVMGSLIGSLFAWLNKREERATQAAQFAHDEAMRKLDNEQALQLADKAMQTAQVAGSVAVAGKEADAFVASQQTGWQPTASHLVEIVRGVMRPLITVYLLAVATYFAANVSALVGGMKAFDLVTLFALYASIIDQLFFLTNLCVSWWFGARGSASARPALKAKGSA